MLKYKIQLSVLNRMLTVPKTWTMQTSSLPELNQLETAAKKAKWNDH